MINRQSVNKNGNWIIAVVAAVWVIFILRAAQVQILDSRKFREYADSQQKATMPLAARRGSIYDSKGHLLAYDIEAKSYTVNPKYMKRPSDAAARLGEITQKPKSYWIQQFNKRPGFLIVARRISQEMASKFDNSGIETLKSRSETQRIYPYGNLASEIIGRADADNKGISGLEKYYDNALSGVDGESIYLKDAFDREVTAWEYTLKPPVNGSDIYLALDLNLQEIVEGELQAQLDSNGAKWGTAIFLNIQNGGILACATLEQDKTAFRRCRAIVDMNEPGSTAKIIPLATAFQNKLFEPDDIINVEHGRFTLGGHIIRDDHPHDLLRCTEIGVYSSNIGAAKLGLTAGADLIYKTLVQFGFGTRTGVDFPGESPGTLYKPENWSRHNLAIICFGYGMSASALQIASAYGVVASGGELLKPYFATKMVTADSVEKTINGKIVVRNVIDRRTANILDGIFRDVVQLGTAKKAMDEMCVIAGKTGTAMRVRHDGRGYEAGKALASFIGYFPADDPRIVGIIMYDEPKTGIYGGDISAPVFKNIAKRYCTLPGNDFLINYRPKSTEKYNSRYANSDGNNAKIMMLSEKRLLNSAITKPKKPISDGFQDFTGLTMREALLKVRAMGLECKLTGSGIVISQNPPAGLDTTGVKSVELIGESK